MIILSHRGYWLTKEEKNTIPAFKRSFELGFGTETDIRDFMGKLVISHDIPTDDKKHISVDDFFELYKSYSSNLPLALNIKADGLQTQLLALIFKHNITNYFVFDMSVPDGLLYIKDNFNVFARCSEYEVEPSFYNLTDGVWLDDFSGNWINNKEILKHINNNKKVCIVSPELHKRSYSESWAVYKDIDNEMISNKMMICTDKPIEAKLYFNEN